MKQTLLAIVAATLGLNAGAQVIHDTVSTGAGYANQVWYSLQNNEQGSAPKNNWDIAFDASGFGSTILINSVAGTMLWNYPKDDTDGWSAIDTVGLSAWPARYNSETSWADGAVGRYADASNPNDLDWGIYNMTTHVVTGDSIYIIKLADGSYKKLWIQSLTGGVYNFKYANIDGTSPVSTSFSKPAYSGKNFGYYSLQTGASLDREPATANWDLLFTQYTAFVPSAYTVTGVLGNAGVELVKVANLPNKTTYADYGAATFSDHINTIGYDWKTFAGMGYTIKDSTVYFAKTVAGDVWKLIFTGFSGSSTGSFMFSKEKLYTQTSVDQVTGNPMTVSVYPNPSTGQNVNIVYSTDDAVYITVSDISGRVVTSEARDAQRGLRVYTIPATVLTTGMYIVTVKAGAGNVQQRIVVQ